MIVLSIAPGIRSMAWSVLNFPRREIRAECIGCKLEHHGNKRFTVSTFEDMLGRAQVHWLILTVLLSRHSPGILALGGQADPKEPLEHVDAARCLLRTLFLHVGIPVVEFDGRGAVLEALGITARQVKPTVKDLFGRSMNKQKPVMTTFLTGAAAARLVFELPYRQDVSRETPSPPTRTEAPDGSNGNNGSLAVASPTGDRVALPGMGPRDHPVLPPPPVIVPIIEVREGKADSARQLVEQKTDRRRDGDPGSAAHRGPDGPARARSASH